MDTKVYEQKDLNALADVLHKKGYKVEWMRRSASFSWPCISVIKKPKMILPFFIHLQSGFLVSTNRLDDHPVLTLIDKVDGEECYTIRFDV